MGQNRLSVLPADKSFMCLPSLSWDDDDSEHNKELCSSNSSNGTHLLGCPKSHG